MAEELNLYNSAYTGPQIDSAVGAVLENKDSWSGKQDALTGTKGQMVGFDAQGKPVAEDPQFLSIRGGNMGGNINMGEAFRILGVIDPDDLREVANKNYVDQRKPKGVSVVLTVAGWDSDTKQQTVAVTGVLADGSKQMVAPYPADDASYLAWGKANIRCFSYAANSLTFTCDEIPAADINVLVKLEETYIDAGEITPPTP